MVDKRLDSKTKARKLRMRLKETPCRNPQVVAVPSECPVDLLEKQMFPGYPQDPNALEDTPRLRKVQSLSFASVSSTFLGPDLRAQPSHGFCVPCSLNTTCKMNIAQGSLGSAFLGCSSRHLSHLRQGGCWCRRRG